MESLVKLYLYVYILVITKIPYIIRYKKARIMFYKITHSFFYKIVDARTLYLQKHAPYTHKSTHLILTKAHTSHLQIPHIFGYKYTRSVGREKPTHDWLQILIFFTPDFRAKNKFTIKFLRFQSKC